MLEGSYWFVFKANTALSLSPLFSNLDIPLAISLGAIPGALSRYYITIFLIQWLGTRFPVGTFVINLSGALLMGFFTSLAIEQTRLAADLQLSVTTGFIGSYTTFSTYALDTAALWRRGNWALTLFYWAGSVVFGGICLELGILLARTLRS
jgi:CrcB protein